MGVIRSSLAFAKHANATSRCIWFIPKLSIVYAEHPALCPTTTAVLSWSLHSYLCGGISRTSVGRTLVSWSLCSQTVRYICKRIWQGPRNNPYPWPNKARKFRNHYLDKQSRGYVLVFFFWRRCSISGHGEHELRRLRCHSCMYLILSGIFRFFSSYQSRDLLMFSFGARARVANVAACGNSRAKPSCVPQPSFNLFGTPALQLLLSTRLGAR